MIPASVIAKMAALNLTMEQAEEIAGMLAQVETATKEQCEEAHDAEIASYQSKNAERQRRYRERHRNVTDVTERNGNVSNVTDPSPKRKVSPCTPSKENNPIPVSETNVSSTKRADAEASLEFETEFWPAYPHKVGKPDALKKFQIARRKVDLETIMSGLTAYVGSKPADRSWCNPSTWLNQERWGDVPAPSAGLRLVQDTGSARPRKRTFEEERNDPTSVYYGVL